MNHFLIIIIQQKLSQKLEFKQKIVAPENIFEDFWVWANKSVSFSLLFFKGIKNMKEN